MRKNEEIDERIVFQILLPVSHNFFDHGYVGFTHFKHRS